MLSLLWLMVAILVHCKVTCSSGREQLLFCSNVFSRKPVAVSATESTLYLGIGSNVFSVPLSSVDNVNGRLALHKVTHRIGTLSESVHHFTDGNETKPFEAFTHQGSTHVWDFVNHQVQISPVGRGNLTVSMSDYFACDQWLNTTDLHSGSRETPSNSTIETVWYEEVEWIAAIVIAIVSFLAIICLICLCLINQEEPFQLWTSSLKSKINSRRKPRSKKLSSFIKTTLNSLSKSNITDSLADSTRNFRKKSMDSFIGSFVPVRRKITPINQLKKSPKLKNSPSHQASPKSQFGYITSEAYTSPFESDATVSQLDTAT